MSGPEYKNQIALGNLLPLLPFLMAVFAGVFSFANLDSRASRNATENVRQDERIAVIESQVSSIAIAAARQDEKLANIIGLLGEINGRLKDMEGKR